MTKLQAIASLLLISDLCSVSSASLFKYADGDNSSGGLRGQRHDHEREGTGAKHSESLTTKEPDQEPVHFMEDSSAEASKSNRSSRSSPSKSGQDSKDKRNNESPGKSNPTGRKQGNSRIIGGYEAKPNVHSYAASLHDDYGHFCGGSLITRNCILSAAHCRGGEYNVALGRHDLRTEEGQVFRVESEVPHPDYDEFTTDFDFMLVFLRSPATLNGDISLVKLNDDPSVPRVGQRVTPMGWGDTDERDEVSQLSDVLMKTEVRVISGAECDESSGNIGGYEDSYNGQITPNMLCAEAPNTDSCQGDSGGPLVTTYGEKQVGVVSWGIGCASEHFPGVYARVSRVYPWIEREVCRENQQFATEAGFKC